MKIVKKGILPKDRVYVGTCYNCKTVMEAKEAELKYTSCRNETAYTASCMLCNVTVSFDLKPPENTND